MYTNEQIRTRDGETIGIRIFLPDESFNTILIVAPSISNIQDDYLDFAQHFQRCGLCVITYDYRGLGDSVSSGLKGYKASLQQWALQDTDAALLNIKQKFPQQELVFLGHGIGGEILGLAPAIQYVSKIIMVNSALSCSRLRRWQDKIWLGAMKTFMKSTSNLLGYFPGKRFGIMNDIPKGVIDEWIHWCDNANGLFDDYPDHNYRKLQLPLLAFSFTDDWKSQRSGVKALLDHFTSACITWHHLNPGQVNEKKIGHSGFFQKTENTKLWDMLMHWINYEKCIGEKGDQKSLTVNHYEKAAFKERL